MVDSLQTLRNECERLLGSTLMTVQSGAAGLPVDTLLIESPLAIARELYLGVLVDRRRECISIMASAAGGMNIEEVAATTPERILTAHVDPAAGLFPFHARRLGFALGLDAAQIKQFATLLRQLVTLFGSSDASLIEINPLVVTDEGDLVALDAKINLDDNALARHPELLALRDIRQEDPREAEAQQYQLNYISLDGDIGCMVNGAGLAMATMDLVQLHGGSPANFLDVGGGTTAERVAAAFRLILSDPGVRVVLVNIFGGIVRCDLIAEGIIAAMREAAPDVPVVVRLEGTNAADGRRMLEQSGLRLETAQALGTAAQRAVALAGGQA
jgi:succinyl-CoA synthetase beta subunit